VICNFAGLLRRPNTNTRHFVQSHCIQVFGLPLKLEFFLAFLGGIGETLVCIGSRQIKRIARPPADRLNKDLLPDADLQSR
jgi:hypothetical protein